MPHESEEATAVQVVRHMVVLAWYSVQRVHPYPCHTHTPSCGQTPEPLFHAHTPVPASPIGAGVSTGCKGARMGGGGEPPTPHKHTPATASPASLAGSAIVQQPLVLAKRTSSLWSEAWILDLRGLVTCVLCLSTDADSFPTPWDSLAELIKKRENIYHCRLWNVLTVSKGTY